MSSPEVPETLSPEELRKQALAELDEGIAKSAEGAQRQRLMELRAQVESYQPHLDLPAPVPSASLRKTVLRYHVYVIPSSLLMGVACVGIFLSFASIMMGMNDYSIVGSPSKGLQYAGMFAAIPLACLLCTRWRRFSVETDGVMLSSRAIGPTLSYLRVGSIKTSSIRGLSEVSERKVLEVRDSKGIAMEIPMSVHNYAILRSLLTKLARLDRRDGT